MTEFADTIKDLQNEVNDWLNPLEPIIIIDIDNHPLEWLKRILMVLF